MKNEINLNVDFKEMLKDPQFLSDTLNGIDRELLLLKKIISTYEKNENRHGVIFTARETETGKMQKIIIDAIYGEPNSIQVKDLTYGIGAECDKRIIFYTLENPGYTKDEYRYEHEMVKGFAKVNNDCGVETFVVEVSLDSNKTYKYNAEAYPDEKKWTLLKKLPRKLEFDKAVFKVFYNQTDQFGGYENNYMDDIDGWFSDTCWCLDIDGISFMYPVWNEEGLFAQGVSITEEGVDELESIKENNVKILEKMFINREITFEKDFPGDITMSIKLWDKPFSYFTNASIKEKERIVEYLRKFDHQISEYWDHGHYLKEIEDHSVRKYFIILEYAFKELEKEISV